MREERKPARAARDRPLRVLLVEDDEDHAVIIERHLSASPPPISLERARDLAAGIGRLAKGGIDAVLLDLSLPDSRFPETLTQVIASDPARPIIVLTALDDLDVALESVHRGAQDYLTKGEISAPLLVRSIHHSIERKQAEMRLKALTETLEDRVIRRTATLELLNQIADAANESSDLETACRFSLREICSYAGWSVGHAFRNDEGRIVSMRVWHPDEPGRFLRFRQATEEEGVPWESIIGRVMSERRPLWANAIDRPGCGFVRWENAREAGLRATLAFPILIGDEATGALEFFSDRPAAPDESMLDVMMRVGVQMGRVFERERAQASLRRSEERFRLLVDGVEDYAVFLLDPRGRVVSWNTGAERIWGYSAEEAIGRSFECFYVSPDVRRREPERALREAESAGRFSDEGRRVRKDGKVFWASTVLTRLQREGGGTRGYAQITRDITERRELEAQMADLASAEQRKIGQELHDDLGQGLTGMAALAESISRKIGSDSLPSPEVLGMLVEGLQEMQGKVRALARGMIPVEVDSRGLTSALEELASATRIRTGIDCRFDWDGSSVVEDNRTATQLFRIAQEAVNNAIKHARPRSIRITFRSRADRLILGVEDDGPGITPREGANDGMGLRIMGYRANRIGATLTLERGEGGGTLLQCALLPTDEVPHGDGSAPKN